MGHQSTRYTRWSPQRGGKGGGAAGGGTGGGGSDARDGWPVPSLGYTPVVPSPVPLPVTGLFVFDDPIRGRIETATNVLG